VAPFWRTAPAFLAAASIAGALNQILIAVYALRGTRAGWRFDTALFRSGLPFAVRAYIVNALCTLALKAPALMFTSSASRSELGFFSIASQVFDAISVVPASIAAVLFPVLMKLGVERWRETRYYMTILMGLTTLASIVVASLAGPLVQLLFGASYAPAAAPLRLVLPAAVFVSGTSVLSQYLATHGMPRSTALAWLAAALVCAVAGPGLVRERGAIGAALTLSAASAVAWIILVALSIRASRRSLTRSTEGRSPDETMEGKDAR
jgi:O-antigen/teichoic acid export membrane protein